MGYWIANTRTTFFKAIKLPENRIKVTVCVCIYIIYTLKILVLLILTNILSPIKNAYISNAQINIHFIHRILKFNENNSTFTSPTRHGKHS